MRRPVYGFPVVSSVGCPCSHEKERWLAVVDDGDVLGQGMADHEEDDDDEEERVTNQENNVNGTPSKVRVTRLISFPSSGCGWGFDMLTFFHPKDVHSFSRLFPHYETDFSHQAYLPRALS